MPLGRFLVTWYSPNEPPANACSNTLYYNASAFEGVDWQNLADDIRDVYRDAMFQTSPLISVAWTIQVRAYDMADATPRPLKAESTSPGNTGAAATLAPREVALCLSYYGDRNLPSTRGRIYFGPFATSAVNSERPSTTLMNSLISVGNALAGIGGEDISWRVYSPTNDTHEHIRHTWVNDEWDTMRSRQLEETMRVTADV